MVDHHPEMGAFRLARRCIPPLVYPHFFLLHSHRAANPSPCRYPGEVVAQGTPSVQTVLESKISDAEIRIICGTGTKAKGGGLEQVPLVSLPPEAVLVIVNAVFFEGMVIENIALFEVTRIFGAAFEATRPLNRASLHLWYSHDL